MLDKSGKKAQKFVQGLSSQSNLKSRVKPVSSNTLWRYSLRPMTVMSQPFRRLSFNRLRNRRRPLLQTYLRFVMSSTMSRS